MALVRKDFCHSPIQIIRRFNCLEVANLIFTVECERRFNCEALSPVPGFFISIQKKWYTTGSGILAVISLLSEVERSCGHVKKTYLALVRNAEVEQREMWRFVLRDRGIADLIPWTLSRVREHAVCPRLQSGGREIKHPDVSHTDGLNRVLYRVQEPRTTQRL